MSRIDTSTVLHVLYQAAGEDGGPTPPDAGTALTDLGFDSLVLIEATTRFERDFGATIPEDRLAGVQTVGDFCGLVNEFLTAER
jgi:acyl carrier protein